MWCGGAGSGGDGGGDGGSRGGGEDGKGTLCWLLVATPVWCGVVGMVVVVMAVVVVVVVVVVVKMARALSAGSCWQHRFSVVWWGW